MRIRDLTTENLDEGPVWDKVKGVAKKIFSPSQSSEPRLPRGEIKRIFEKILNGEQLDRMDMSQIKNIYRNL